MAVQVVSDGLDSASGGDPRKGSIFQVALSKNFRRHVHQAQGQKKANRRRKIAGETLFLFKKYLVSCIFAVFRLDLQAVVLMY